ncbi:MAG: hypothetical protein M3Z15_04655, partial [Pseudomonadota bacterium]|nr:hypothetical protein [Pseudomonadota bacterium]
SDDRATPAPATKGAGATRPADAGAKPDDDEDEWRHAPVAPVDERNPLKSLGKAISDTVTGSEGEASGKPKR